MAATLIIPPGAAVAVPSASERRAQATRVKEQIDALDVKVEVAAEDHNEARQRHQEASARVRATKTELAKVRKRIGVLESRLSSRVEGMYRAGPLSMVDVLLGAASFEEFATTWDLLRDMNLDEAQNVAELKGARARAIKAERVLVQAQTQAKRNLDVMTARKRSIESRLAERRRALAGLEGEIRALEREERARALASARSRRAFSSRSLLDWGSPRRAPRSEVVQIAMRYMGTPYRWGASGPDAFDCSGFTMHVYSQVGVSLAHSSRAQIGQGERVPRSKLEPGDLVFFGRGRIHHVGIYIGGGRYIHSPNTGDVVSVDSLGGRGDFAGAARP